MCGWKIDLKFGHPGFFRLGASKSRLMDELSTRPDYFSRVWLQAEYHWLHVIPLKMCRETCYINGVFVDRWVGDDDNSLLPLDQLQKLVIFVTFPSILLIWVGSKNSGTPKWMVKKMEKPY